MNAIVRTIGGTDRRWALVQKIFSAALAAGPGRRELLAIACGRDAALRQEVEALLEAHERPGPADRLELELHQQLHSGGPSIGARVGPYMITQKLDAGGMGLLYAARDERTGATVALKVLPDLKSTDQLATRRFATEARAAARLDHPNICTVLEFSQETAERLYIAMPLYRGETLAARIARAPLDAAAALDVAITVAKGLDHAHQRGIVHRDIKPANLFLVEDGGLRILDFGIAKIIGLQMTFTGAILGTLPYMSPEQAASRTIDGRSDLWSLGVVLYEMVAGRRPFDGPNPQAVVAALLRSEPAPLEGMRGARELNRLLGALLAKSPAARFADAGTAITAFRETLHQLTPH